MEHRIFHPGDRKVEPLLERGPPSLSLEIASASEQLQDPELKSVQMWVLLLHFFHNFLSAVNVKTTLAPTPHPSLELSFY